MLQRYQHESGSFWLIMMLLLLDIQLLIQVQRDERISDRHNVK